MEREHLDESFVCHEGELWDDVRLRRTRESTQVTQWLLGSLAASTPLDWCGSGSVAPQFLFHAVVDGCNVGCNGE